MLEEKQWRGEIVPLPPNESTQQGPTAPPDEWEALEHNLAPVTRGGTDCQPKANYKPFTQFKAEIQRVLGNAPTYWSRITITKQLRGINVHDNERNPKTWVRLKWEFEKYEKGEVGGSASPTH